MGRDGGHMVAEMFANMSRWPAKKSSPSLPKSGHTAPMSVEEAVRERCARLYPEDGAEYAEQVVKSFRDFVALAEKRKLKQDVPAPSMPRIKKLPKKKSKRCWRLSPSRPLFESCVEKNL
jgi:hypothetical protein